MSVNTTLPDYRTSNTNRPIDFLIHYRSVGNLDLEQPYQRGSVWGLTRKQNLIKSFLMGVPVPAIVINDRYGAHFVHADYDEERNASYAVVDGKQRTLTILGFINDEFAIPGEWLGERGLVKFSGMTVANRRGLRGVSVPVCEGKFPTLEQERELFDLINFGGVAQGDRDGDAA